MKVAEQINSQGGWHTITAQAVHFTEENHELWFYCTCNWAQWMPQLVVAEQWVITQ